MPAPAFVLTTLLSTLCIPLSRHYLPPVLLAPATFDPSEPLDDLPQPEEQEQEQEQEQPEYGPEDPENDKAP
ncbi:MAG TPA: hypothetical protein DIT61_08795 [Pseudomonas sp.]|jgi:hypothetical protein|nr:hypothetical protein [Pseudomonadales bacterium]MAP76735.1 hypothetical protein [Pseudomonadales bacterium]HBT57928.1 hypothetical protein [Pseudomonas sp.]HCP03598.1 hypothetical protein [Pseudomonas sp.]